MWNGYHIVLVSCYNFMLIHVMYFRILIFKSW